MAPLGGSPARAFRKESGKVLLADMSTFLPTDYERTNIGENEAAVLRIVSDSLRNVSTIFDHDVSVEKANDVVLLSRTNTPPWSTQIEDESASGLNQLSKVINKQMGGNRDGKIQIFTAHKFKGLQGGLVVVLDAMEGRYPLIHPDWVFNRIFGDTLQKRIDEERRLFYVALTRAKDVLVILTDGSQRSPYLEDIKIGATLQWGTLRPAMGTGDRLVLMIGNAAGRGKSPTVNIKDHLTADGFRFNPAGPSWSKSSNANDFNITEFLKKRSWLQVADGVEIRVCNEVEDVLERYLIEQGALTRLNG